MESLFEPRILMDKYVNDEFIKNVSEKFKEININLENHEIKSIIKTYFNYYVCDPLEPLSIDELKEYYIMFTKKETSLKDEKLIIATINIISCVFHDKLSEGAKYNSIIRPNKE